MPRDRQAVNVSVTLYGWQDTAVTAHQPETAGAALSVRVGGALVWMHDRATVATFAQVWLAEGYRARLLPRAATHGPKTVRDVNEPRVMVEASGSPAVSARMLQDPGTSGRMWIAMGRIAFDVRDFAAFRSTTVAFRRAQEIAGKVFIGDAGKLAPEPSPMAKAAEVGGRAFISPAGSPYQRAMRARALPIAPGLREGRPDRGAPTR